MYKTKPVNAISGDFDYTNNTFSYFSDYRHESLLSKPLLELLKPMFLNLFQVSYKEDVFEKFIKISKEITSQRFVSVLDVNKCEFQDFALKPDQT